MQGVLGTLVTAVLLDLGALPGGGAAAPRGKTWEDGSTAAITFDGDRRYGYGGYSYHPRFWQDTVRVFHDH
jgi:hypothetical protein